MSYAGYADRAAIEAEGDWASQDQPATIHGLLTRTARRHPGRPAFSFQLFSDPDAPAETLDWQTLHQRSVQVANLLRSLGVNEGDTVAMLLPNCTEAVTTYLGAQIAGIVAPINPLLEPAQIAALLRESGAKVVVTLRGFPKTDVGQKTAKAVAQAPSVETVLEVDLARYLTGVKRLAVPLIRPRVRAAHRALVYDLNKEAARQPKQLTFADSAGDRVSARFHTGGTTGMPKVAEHRYSGLVYNGWIGQRLLFDESDVLICPLPMFHVFAAVVAMGCALASGAHLVMPTPAGYRGDGVFDNFWKLIERWRVTFIIAVPTAMSALMQRPVDADISSLRLAFSGSAPLPVELYKRFEAAAGVTICEGYGLTEATCLVSVNPPDGEKKIGSIGLPFPYTSVRIVRPGTDQPLGPDTVGEICVASPGVTRHTYTDEAKNKSLYWIDPGSGRHYLRTGDLGRMDEDDYIWITGRSKDLIIRGGHNIDPAEIEEALSAHPAVAMAGAIGQPDVHAGELPCAYVELVSGASVTPEELRAHLEKTVHEKAARPKHVEILPELPKTAVGKIFKPDLRRRAITRVFDAALGEAGVKAHVEKVVEDQRRGLVAKLRSDGPADEAGAARALDGFTVPWDWAEGG
ncbi:acyl-CoA synthetase [Pseudoroseicyclus aestuarii]|uniref:Fatty-acyl-CoA synthase/long-chain acyl-CoA synthetase n=1 Tax=Pseudoroseicyclus aestuarii TaxID=1795041 RepID=A0A318SVD2_9RHOB|nr:acyl-CoA synthetase [Pseudoroseicyclus aestuarii]PYE85452.1 fatty-acyl-CoA synthase/long-chain acyl-CoA synthetase [Pseudoroseicyclus aestuarii]